jgi:hypothetical protein
MGTEVGTSRPEGRTGAFGAVEPGIVREAGELVGGASEIRMGFEFIVCDSPAGIESGALQSAATSNGLQLTIGSF